MPSLLHFSVVTLAGQLLAAALPAPSSSSPPLVTKYPNPHQDPFYDLPGNISSYKPGEVVRSRTVHSTEFGPLVNTRQVFYRTSNRLDQATGSVATIFIPDLSSYPPKVVSYQSPEDALDVSCAPSWASVNTSSEQESYLVVPVIPLATYALAQGWYFVNADDDELSTDWLVGETEGGATLDGIRATINELDLSQSQTTVTMLGYSGGAHETVWAASVASTYAPEINFVGAAYGGTPVDQRIAYNTLNAGPNAALAGGTLVGLSRGYPELNETLDSLMTPAGKAIFAQLQGSGACLNEHKTDFANVNFSSPEYFTSDPINNHVTSKVLNEESLLSNVNPKPVPVPKFPRLVWHGTADTVVSYSAEAEYVQQQCSKGADIAFVSYTGLDHNPAALAGIPGALLFITQAFDHTLVKTPCGANISTPVIGSAEAIEVLGEKVDDLLKELL